MIAQVPQVLVDTGTAALAITAIITTAVLVSRLRPSRWLWRTVVGDPISSWFRVEVREAVKGITAELVDPKIAALDEGQRTIREQIETIAWRTEQLIPNNGGHLADAVNRTERKLDAHLVESASRAARLDRLDPPV